MNYKSPRFWNIVGFVVCVAALATAFFLQYGVGLRPCLLCVMTRIVFGMLGFIFLIAAIHNPARCGLRVYAFLICLIAVFGIALASRHYWLEHQPPSQTAVCVPGLSVLLKTMPIKDVVRVAVLGSSDCAHEDWSFLGMGLTLCTLLFLLGFELMGLLQLLWPYKRR